jgi:hypothetical protein
VNFDEFKPEGLNEKLTVANLKYGNHCTKRLKVNFCSMLPDILESIALVGVSEVSPACPSHHSSIKMKMSPLVLLIRTVLRRR